MEGGGKTQKWEGRGGGVILCLLSPQEVEVILGSLPPSEDWGASPLNSLNNTKLYLSRVDTLGR
jgi:hypothetical protein